MKAKNVNAPPWLAALLSLVLLPVGVDTARAVDSGKTLSQSGLP